MSQRSSETFPLNINVNLNLNVSNISFSNHNGFTGNQIDNAIEEFKEKIQSYLTDRVVRDFYHLELLNSVDFVSFEVNENK